MYIKLTNSQKRTADLYLMSLNQAKATKVIVQTADGPAEPERNRFWGASLVGAEEWNPKPSPQHS